jgi:hypothetical protein
MGALDENRRSDAVTVYVTTVYNGPMKPDYQRFNVGPITFTEEALARINYYGTAFWVEALKNHVMGHCICGNPACDAEITQLIERGEPIITIAGPSKNEPDPNIAVFTNAARTRTVVCAATEDAIHVMAEVETIKPEIHDQKGGA